MDYRGTSFGGFDCRRGHLLRGNRQIRMLCQSVTGTGYGAGKEWLPIDGTHGHRLFRSVDLDLGGYRTIAKETSDVTIRYPRAPV